MLEMKALAEATASIIREQVAPLLARIETLESRPFEPDNVVILRLVQDEVAKIPAPENGKSVDPEQVASLVAEEVERAVAALPRPQDGKSVVVEDVAPWIAEVIEKAVAELPAPRSIRGVVVDRDGNAVFTYSDGDTENVGRVVGKDAQEVDWAAVEVKLRELVDAIPKPKDGVDGFSLDDFDCQPVDERTIKLMFTRGETMHSFELEFPVTIYRGVFKADETYARGDATTWGGSLWIAEKETAAKPDSPDSGWRLAVKKGRDGKDAK